MSTSAFRQICALVVFREPVLTSSRAFLALAAQTVKPGTMSKAAQNARLLAQISNPLKNSEEACLVVYM